MTELQSHSRQVIFYVDLPLGRLSSSSLWLPHHCIPVLGAGGEAEKAIHDVCKSDRGALMEPAYAQRYFGVRIPRQANYNSFVLDYW